MSRFGTFFVHEVTTRQKVGVYDTVGPPVVLSPNNTPPDGVFVDEQTRMVRSPGGSEVVSSTTITGPPSVKDRLAVGTEVTLPSGDTTTVITRNVRTFGRLSHVEAACE